MLLRYLEQFRDEINMPCFSVGKFKGNDLKYKARFFGNETKETTDADSIKCWRNSASQVAYLEEMDK